MPTSYTTTVTVAGYASANYGSQLDSLEIITGSTNPYELPQPPSARASFYGLPVVSGVTQTPDWWIGKKLTFTIDPQGSTGTVTWAGICVGVNTSMVDPQGTVQICELDLQGQTSKLSLETVQNVIPASAWTNLPTFLNDELQKLTWADAPWGLTWAGVTSTWATYDVNKSGCTIVNSGLVAGQFYDDIDLVGYDVLSWLDTVFSNKLYGLYGFDDTTVYLNTTNLTGATPATTLSVEDCVIAASMVSNASQSDVINAAKVENALSGFVEYYSDATSVNTYGYRPFDMGLAWDATAASAMQQRVKGYKSPNSKLQSITINLDLVDHANVWWTSLYKLVYWYRLTLTDVPSVFGGNDTYQVRGVQLNLTNKHAEATLLIVPTTVYDPA